MWWFFMIIFVYLGIKKFSEWMEDEEDISRMLREDKKMDKYFKKRDKKHWWD